ncbi:MAG: alpha-L-arabinofuranosidase C-terminal domain-containing protein [Promethearchaeota archaeon]
MYKETKHPLLNEFPLERVPADLFENMAELKPPIIRYPGGCFSDTYHWKDGIGPRKKRPKRKNKAWGGIKSLLYNVGPKERNHFGTDEFLNLCEKLGSEKYLNINFGSGTIEEAAEWVEYVNGDENSKYGKIRIKNGHKEPYGVKYWGIANEIYGFWEKGYCKTPQEYAKRYIEFAKAMRKVDPSIKLIACGCNRSNWNQPLLELIKDHVDYLSVHIYLPLIGLLSNLFRKKPLPATEDVFYSMVNSAYIVEDLIIRTEEDIIAVLGPNGLDKCKIALDEWNIWYHYSQIYRADKPPYVLRDGLWSAGVLNTLIRHAHSIGMANFAQMVNCIGMILTYEKNIIVNPHYHVFKMYGDALQSHYIPIELDCPILTSKPFGKNIPTLKRPVLDAAATISEDGQILSLFIVNKHFKESVQVNIYFEGSPDIKINSDINLCVLYHDNPFINNTKNLPNEINLKEKTLNDGINPYLYEFPPHSVTSLQFHLKK